MLIILGGVFTIFKLSGHILIILGGVFTIFTLSVHVLLYFCVLYCYIYLVWPHIAVFLRWCIVAVAGHLAVVYCYSSEHLTSPEFETVSTCENWKKKIIFSFTHTWEMYHTYTDTRLS